MRSATCCVVVGVVIGLVLVIGGVILIKKFPGIVEEKVKDSLNLETQEGLSFENWQKIKIPLDMQYYFFNVTNPYEVTFENADPEFNQVGPYTFSEMREKVNLTWNESDNTVTYKQIKTYTFDKGRSVGTEDDTVTIPNIPAIAIVKKARTMPLPLQIALKGLLKIRKIPLYVTKSVRELLFDGYFDDFAQAVASASGQHVLPDGMFAFFYKLNASDDGEYTIYTGKGDVKKYTVINKWNGKSELLLWKNGTHCNDINGTDGTQFPPFIDKSYTPRVYVSEICRSSYLVYEKEVEHHGILSYRFTTDFNVMADPAINPDNGCFCSKDSCMFTGLVSMHPCQQDAPIFISPPHFYQSSPLLKKSIKGLNPNKKDHGVYVDIEPLTGTVLNARKTSQVNVDMEPMFPLFEDTNFYKMPRLQHPVLWMSEGASIDSVNAESFKSMAITPVKIGTILIYVVLVLGVIILLTAVVFQIFKKRKNSISNFSSVKFVK